jgi:hypothetical protein
MSEAIEAAAKAGFNAEYDDVEDHDTWEELPEATRDRFRQIHGVALAAAAPLIPDVGEYHRAMIGGLEAANGILQERLAAAEAERDAIRQATADEIAAAILEAVTQVENAVPHMNPWRDWPWHGGVQFALEIVRNFRRVGGGGGGDGDV